MKLLTIAVLAAGVTFTVGPVTGLLAQTDSAARPAAAAQETGSDAGLQDWLTAFRARALAAGIDGLVFDRAMQTVRYDTEVIRRDLNQSEFTKTIWDYLATATSDLRIANGKKALAEQADALAQIEKRYGVEKEIVTAIWGLESAYGTFRGSDPVLTSLATLAYDGRRRAFFEGELLDALRILQAGDTTPTQMQGSWAGAMGHTQFMPSSFQLYAEDFTADGKRDIWGDDPRDALASTAAYLKHFGWVSGRPWGVEVQLPDGFDYLLAGRDILKTAEEWTALGVAPVTGALEDHGPASLLLPGGAEGAAFLIYTNFAVIERYNSADAYVIGVGHLADRIAGGDPIRHSWPVQDRALSYDERIELQTRLTAQGFDTVKIDAKIGPLTISAVRAFQLSQERLPDGYASLGLLEALRAVAGE